MAAYHLIRFIDEARCLGNACSQGLLASFDLESMTLPLVGSLLLGIAHLSQTSHPSSGSLGALASAFDPKQTSSSQLVGLSHQYDVPQQERCAPLCRRWRETSDCGLLLRLCEYIVEEAIVLVPLAREEHLRD